MHAHRADIDQLKMIIAKEDEVMPVIEEETMLDYQKRFIDEYYEVLARYKKLHEIIVRYDAGTLDFKPDCSLELLKRQAKAMGEYLYVLEVRAEIEKIILVVPDVTMVEPKE